ncbi:MULTISPECIES: LysR family transcriptional regulator [Streptomyces]|uniref:LysR substrate-binding domain-containing protein n=1 Tax=Streptomyces TaxID=1883 RepID=UPI00207A9A24|nr:MULTISPECIES: LysR family transcriptional regulator [Streptomyces]MCM9076945.1 LysR family transcriptional regulator [Streptomyces spororaveus]MCX5308402.1 LysR family transcriptional regulator [Streptomyces sp. NBC_00160]
MTLDDLRVFVAVCRSGSLSAVARDLGCTQSAVSQHIRRLEKRTGASLLERHARGVVPTEAGRILRTAAAEGIAGLDGALRRLDDLVRGGGGTVRVTTGATTVRHFMSEAVVTFRRSHPEVSLEFQTENSSRSCFDALAADDLDLAWITIGAPVRGIELRPVMELPWVLAVGADDPLAGRARIDPADLAGIRHIRLPENSASRAHLDAAFAASGIRVSSDTSVADWDTALLLAELGLGHAVVPALPGWQVPGSDGPLRLVPIPALPPLAVGWAVRRWAALARPALVFADEVARSCRARAAGQQ